MATFSFSGVLPQTKALITSAQLRSRYNDLGNWITAFNAQGWTLPNTVAAQYQALLFNTGLAWSLNHVLRADAAVQLTGVASLAAGDMLYFNGTNLVELSVGTSGQTLKLSSTTPTWTSVAAPNNWENKTGNFTSANGGRYQLSTGVTSIALHTPAAGDEFWIKPQIGVSWITNPIAFTGTPQIAGAASTAFTANENGILHFVSNGTDFDVAAYPIAR